MYRHKYIFEINAQNQMEKIPHSFQNHNQKSTAQERSAYSYRDKLEIRAMVYGISNIDNFQTLTVLP